MEYGLLEFIKESNKIEGIDREPTLVECEAHRNLLELDEIKVGDLENFVWRIAEAKLRTNVGMDVRVGSHYPPRGGPAIKPALKRLLEDIAISEGWGDSPFQAHLKYENLHPFMDGNGRSGRVLWAWHMRVTGRDPFALPFLHRFYYQSLDEKR